MLKINQIKKFINMEDWVKYVEDEEYYYIITRVSFLKLEKRKVDIRKFKVEKIGNADYKQLEPIIENMKELYKKNKWIVNLGETDISFNESKVYIYKDEIRMINNKYANLDFIIPSEFEFMGENREKNNIEQLLLYCGNDIFVTKSNIPSEKIRIEFDKIIKRL